ncbi:MAG: TIGR02221 family CRISPR-associated protein, partial [Magnetococcales bacterium]|nr:TIGR02221 family CRISPR-associated protein [Magnetococcales bacterium]
MQKLLITFLGKAVENSSYRLTRYRFDDGSISETRYFGQALAQQQRPDRMILLGTRGSMWDVLFDDLGQGNEHQEDRTALIDEAATSSVSEERLQRLTPLLERQIGLPCQLCLIPYGRDAAEQVQILEVMARHVGEQDQVIIDVTHGFRYLPMLGLLSALYLRAVKKTTIQGLYYGAMEMTEHGETPVLRLDGLLTLA